MDVLLVSANREKSPCHAQEPGESEKTFLESFALKGQNRFLAYWTKAAIL